MTPMVAAAMATKFQKVTRAPAEPVGEEAAERARERPDQRAEKRQAYAHLRELRLEEQRKCGRVADERAEGPDIEPGHHPSVLAPDDDELVLEGRSRRSQVVHVAIGAEHRDADQRQPHQTRVLEIEPRSGIRRGHIEADPAVADQDRDQELHAADADIATGGVETQRPALDTIRIEEGDIGHARGEIAAAEAGTRGHDQHQPERRVGPADEIGERDGGDEQQRRAHHGPVAAAETWHRKSVGKPHQRTDKPGKSHEREQLVGCVREARLRQLGRNDAPDEPDREAEMLGHDRPDQIASGDELALLLPEFFILRVPFRDPGRAACAHLLSFCGLPPRFFLRCRRALS
jgi:hypothetical protein